MSVAHCTAAPGDGAFNCWRRIWKSLGLSPHGSVALATLDTTTGPSEVWQRKRRGGCRDRKRHWEAFEVAQPTGQSEAAVGKRQCADHAHIWYLLHEPQLSPSIYFDALSHRVRYFGDPVGLGVPTLWHRILHWRVLCRSVRAPS